MKDYAYLHIQPSYLSLTKTDEGEGACSCSASIAVNYGKNDKTLSISDSGGNSVFVYVEDLDWLIQALKDMQEVSNMGKKEEAK